MLGAFSWEKQPELLILPFLWEQKAEDTAQSTDQVQRMGMGVVRSPPSRAGLAAGSLVLREVTTVSGGLRVLSGLRNFAENSN